eukprot:scaffold58986_cov95-Attheya_sp.AAC.3
MALMFLHWHAVMTSSKLRTDCLATLSNWYRYHAMTGAGKSHLMRTAGVLLGGVCLIVFVRIRFKNLVLTCTHNRDRDAPPLNQ